MKDEVQKNPDFQSFKMFSCLELYKIQCCRIVFLILFFDGNDYIIVFWSLQ